MIWHIFKKDWKLLWPLVLIVAAVHIMNAALQFMLGHFGQPPALGQIARVFPNAVLLGIAALIVTAVHQDAIPGDRQDWLVRPIRRRDLILAKLLFILVAVHGPMLLADLVHGMATGFTFWDSLSAALSRGTLLLLIFSLPALAVAAMTSTLVEVIGGSLAIVLVIAIFLFAIDESYLPLGPGSSVGWMMFNFWFVVALAAAAVIIPLQYFRRTTLRARGIALGAILLLPIPALIPWAPAFSFQQWLSADPAAAEAIAIAFNPASGRMTIEPGGRSRENSAWLPLRVSGLPPESFVHNDRADFRIIDRDGAIMYRGRTNDPQVADGFDFGPFHIDDFPVRTTAGGDVRTHQLITLPKNIYDLVRSQPVRVEMDYSLTLFRIETSDTITPRNGDKRIANFGWCKTRLNDDYVDVGCLNLGTLSQCTTLVLENTASGQRNPAADRCPPSSPSTYSPFTANFYPTAPQRFRDRLTFRDSFGLAKYPVDSSQLPNAQVVLKSYQPAAHFTRHLVIPAIRLGDWEADTREIAKSAKPPS